MSRPNPVTRDTIVRGPGTVVFDGVQIDGRDGINATIDSATQDLTTDAKGKIGTMKTDQVGKVTATPYGRVTKQLLALLYPHRSPVIGSSLLGAADRPLTIRSAAGRKVVFSSAALTRPPELRLSPVSTAFGQCEFTAVLARLKYPDEPGAFVDVIAEPFGTFDSARPQTGAVYTATYGDVTFRDTVDGWRVAVEPQIEIVTVDNLGSIDIMLSGMNVTARCTPVGFDEQDIISMLPATRARGADIVGPDLVIAGTNGLAVALKNAALLQGPLQWGNAQLRTGELMFTANVDGATGKLYEIMFSD